MTAETQSGTVCDTAAVNAGSPSDASASTAIAANSCAGSPGACDSTANGGVVSTSTGGVGGQGPAGTGDDGPELTSKNSAKSTSTDQQNILGPPSDIDPNVVHKLYRGASGQVHDQDHRIWVEFPALELCWACWDKPAHPLQRVPLLGVSCCRGESFLRDDEELLRVDVCVDGAESTPQGGGVVTTGGAEQPLAAADISTAEPKPVVSIMGSSKALRDFQADLAQLLASRDREGARGLEHIQRSLFQYLWLRQQRSLSANGIHEAQAVLTFNLDPKDGVSYMRQKLSKTTDVEVGQWLANMSREKGGLDPSVLGDYFSRKDTLEVFRAFVKCLDFAGLNIVGALRLMFDTFKPGGEGQVMERILGYFAEAYFEQWKRHKESGPASSNDTSNYSDPDAVHSVAVSLIMLNTEIHLAPKKMGKKAAGVPMSFEEYVKNTRGAVCAEEAPEDSLKEWYEDVKQVQISVEPLPRAPFPELPVLPNIEGWLIAVYSAEKLLRLWAVLAVRRLYLFSDESEVKPKEIVDLKDMSVSSVATDAGARERFDIELRGAGKKRCFCLSAKAAHPELQDADTRALELCQAPGKQTMLQWQGKPRSRLILVAESNDLMERWVSLISVGPY
eukprot:TRINITY_DN55529_c0_g1_i1.p1 TRINITY_DN55529_c0_g1~~TRINITY_DN55529_c0_g1_i1.p1  ORF type:complete len:694 (-),score=112.97 TRINITY_DN55529_c0_g1_i1:61-1914(-)